MKNDLISRSELLKEFDPNGELLDPIMVRMRIVQQPTAYDVENVVAELEEEKLEYETIYKRLEKEVPNQAIYYLGLESGCKVSIEIVRNGGKE